MKLEDLPGMTEPFEANSDATPSRVGGIHRPSHRNQDARYN